MIKNKKGKTHMSTGVTIMITLFIVAVLAVGGYFLFLSPTTQSTTPGGVTDVTSCPDSTATLTINNYSELVGGTDPSPTFTAGVIAPGSTYDSAKVTQSVTSDSTTFPVGQHIALFGSAANYIDTYKEVTVSCGGSNVDFPMLYSTSDNPAITWYNDDDNAMTNDVAGGATNQTDLSVGETFTLKLKLQGTSGESSGDGVLVIEFPASTSANITKVTLDGNNPISVPSVHTLQNAASKAVAFDVPAVENGKVAEHSLEVTLGTTKDLSGGVLTDWYAKQWYIDDDKTLKYGIQDSDGTLKYENTEDSDFYINAA